ncbi:MAG TPA: hypothetical protein VD963_08940 [Phycisphaerales bacterium]|nr:hypothetical protein [Phycisphaerales bacterium]
MRHGCVRRLLAKEAAGMLAGWGILAVVGTPGQAPPVAQVAPTALGNPRGASTGCGSPRARAGADAAVVLAPACWAWAEPGR